MSELFTLMLNREQEPEADLRGNATTPADKNRSFCYDPVFEQLSERDEG
jgi:inosine/xanthosine triphosphate pyrophosphatase family protein